MSTVTEETPEITEPTTHKWVYLFDEGPATTRHSSAAKAPAV
jgi:hypothetical protein